MFDANSHKILYGTCFLLLARRVLSEMKIVKSRPARFLCRPGGMRGGAGGRLEGGLRSADLNLRIEICVMDSRFGFDTPARVYDKGGG